MLLKEQGTEQGVSRIASKGKSSRQDQRPELWR